MTSRFWVAFGITFSMCSAVLACAALLLGWSLTSPTPDRFRTSAFAFDLPKGWKCSREVTEYVCRLGPLPSDAIVILTMKLRSQHDTLDAYEAHLRGHMPSSDGTGDARLLEIRRRSLNGIEWVQGSRMGSEVKGWETTYLASVTAEIGVLITFSVHPNYRSQRKGDLEMMARTIVMNQRGL